ncbi:MAG: mechanosensitive ion channel [Candidatus Delongbacteria bacterium]|nr:mechanosensitive ion channel [Candidatus Delongbacteria bacterium]
MGLLSDLPIIASGLVLMLLGLFGWYWGRDFIAGIILKSENFTDAERMVQYRHLHGRIIRMGLRYLEFQTEEGEIIKIPYRRIHHESPLQLRFRDLTHSATWNFSIPDPVDTDPLLTLIRQTILSSPWAMAGYDPIITLIPESEGILRLKITVFTLNPSQSGRLKQELVKIIDGLNGNRKA